MIATVVTVPVVLALGLLLGGAGGDHGAQHPSAAPEQGPVTVSAPPSTSPATVSRCAQVISGLPLTLDGQNVRLTESQPASGQIQAWGDPPIVLRCGVSRPKSLVPGSSANFISATGLDGPYYDVSSSGGANTYTTVDRAIYIAVTVPAKYHAGPLPTISRAIAKVLPPVCTVDPQEPNPNKLCTRRP